MGFYAETDYDDDFWDKAEELPGCFIIQREIQKAVRGEDFFYNDEDTGKPVKLIGIDISVFAYYYKLWEDYHYFGLPGGRGSSSERRWLLEHLKTFEKAYRMTKDWMQEQAQRRAEIQGRRKWRT